MRKLSVNLVVGLLAILLLVACSGRQGETLMYTNPILHMDYSDPERITPMFFRAQMVNGVVDVSNCEVVR